MTPRSVSLRSRTIDGESRTVLRHDWDAAKAAMIICDMWDSTQCVSAARRVVQMAPRVNEVAARLRRDGALIVHAPAGCMEYYAGTAARQRARHAPPVDSPVPVDWNDWDPSREAPLPASLADDTPCSCEAGDPCTVGGLPYPWTRQIPSIEVSTQDAVTDDGRELLALLEERGIEDVIVTGVHTNRCVLGRPYGIRQLVYWGKRVVLCRDLTDSYHRDPRGHDWGNEQIVTHIERYWCSTLTSDQLVAGSEFRWGSHSESR
jgi:nicotinamidase-related amidase